MKVKVQTCWNGRTFLFRALIAGGKRVHLGAGDDPKWNRKVATEMLDLIEADTGLDRTKIRFVHI